VRTGERSQERHPHAKPMARQNVYAASRWGHDFLYGRLSPRRYSCPVRIHLESIPGCDVLWWVAGGVGIGMGYHRLLTHRGYKTPKWVEYVLTVCGTLALEGGPIFFVAIHRMHHQNTDKEGDPHSPQDGGLWSHVGWILTGQSIHNDSGILLPYVPDLRKDKFHIWISRWHWIPMTVLGGLLLLLGGWPFLLWGIFFRTVLNLHSTWLVNSATHMRGSRRFSTGDTSRNNFLGSIVDLRRRLAQQPSCPSAIGSTRFGLVRVRSKLVRDLRITSNRACFECKGQNA